MGNGNIGDEKSGSVERWTMLGTENFDSLVKLVSSGACLVKSWDAHMCADGFTSFKR